MMPITSFFCPRSLSITLKMRSLPRKPVTPYIYFVIKLNYRVPHSGLYKVESFLSFQIITGYYPVEQISLTVNLIWQKLQLGSLIECGVQGVGMDGSLILFGLPTLAAWSDAHDHIGVCLSIDVHRWEVAGI